MISINYLCQGFDPSWGFPHGWRLLKIDWIDLVWAAVTVGKLGLDDLIAHGQFSVDEIRFRYYLIYSHLMQEDDVVVKSPLYESLDSTEKGAASYFIGMAASKLVCAFLLDVPCLVHLEKIKALYDVGLHGRSRPDLLGINSNGQWVVCEAKGRTHGFSQTALDKAKTQTRQISHISGKKPVLRVATESYFSPHFSIRIIDPEEEGEDEFDIVVDETQYYSSYYSTFRNFAKLSSRYQLVKDYPYDFIDNESMGVSIGVNRSIIDSIEAGKSTRELIRGIPSDLHESHQEIRRITKYYPDGIAITLDQERWGSQKMSVEPSSRY